MLLSTEDEAISLRELAAGSPSARAPTDFRSLPMGEFTASARSYIEEQLEDLVRAVEPEFGPVDEVFRQHAFESLQTSSRASRRQQRDLVEHALIPARYVELCDDPPHAGQVIETLAAEMHLSEGATRNLLATTTAFPAPTGCPRTDLVDP